jgi:hypothetical protein
MRHPIHGGRLASAHGIWSHLRNDGARLYTQQVLGWELMKIDKIDESGRDEQGNDYLSGPLTHSTRDENLKKVQIEGRPDCQSFAK